MKTIPEQIICADNMRSFCYTNAHLVTRARGILLTLHGRGDPGTLSDSPWAELLAEKGIVQIFPYYDPWAWLNRSAVNLCDALIGVICSRFGLGEEPLLVCEGGSMGGLSALLYPIVGRYKPAAAAANCPACDLVYHYSARPDLPRYFVCAYGGGEETDVEAVMKAHSPMHRLEELPDIPILLVHGLADPMIAAGPNSETFARRVNERGGRAVYIPVEGMGHCNMPEETAKKYNDYILSFFA